jgi:GntR family transcriptional regulator, rspAB operon transcriptional repressor
MTSVKNVRHSDRAYEALKQKIIQLKLAPGAPLDENSLMEALEIGRTPLREALQRLSQEELVKNIPHKGYFVANINHGDPLHVFEVRKQLEAFSAHLAAQRASQEDLDEMEAYLAELEREADTGDFDWNLDADLRMHQLIARASGNPFLQQTLDRLFSLTIRLLYVNRLPVSFVKDELDIYRALLDAIKRHDPPAAAAAMIKHLGFPLLSASGMEGVVVWPPSEG